jgi:hypothetical protein
MTLLYSTVDIGEKHLSEIIYRLVSVADNEGTWLMDKLATGVGSELP